MTWWHKAALGTVPVVGLFLCALLWRVDTYIPLIVADLHTNSLAATASLNSVSLAADNTSALVVTAKQRVAAVAVTQSKLNATVDNLNHRLTDLCSEPQGCGLIPDASRTLNTARGTMGQIEVAAHSFDEHSSTFYDQEATNDAVVQKTLTDFDALINDPDWSGVLRNFNASSLDIAGIAKNLDALTGDGKVWLHQKLFPTKKKGVADAFDAAGDRVHHWMPSIF